MHYGPRIAAALLLLAPAVLSVDAGAAGMLLPDRITLHRVGPSLGGIKVLAATATGVKYSRFAGGPAKTIPAASVKEIRWGDGGRFNAVISEFGSGDFQKALDHLRRCPAPGQPDAPRDFWYGPYRPILEGMSLVELKRYKEALPKLEAAITKYPDSFYVIPAIQAKAKAHLALTQLQQAADTFLKLDPKGNYTSLTAGAPYGKLWQLRGRIGIADALVQLQGKETEAGRVYGELAKAAERILADPPAALRSARPELEGIYQRSLVGRAEVLMKTGQLKAAREWIGEIGNKVTSRTGRTRLFLALGDLSMVTAKEAADTDKKLRYKEALLAYMRVYIVYRDQKEPTRRALFGAAKASQLLDTRDDRLRAVRLYKELWEKHRGSPEATEARKLLGLLGVTVD